MELNNILNEIAELRTKMLEMLDAIPNTQPGVERINKKPAIAIVKFSHVQGNKGNLSPSYYMNDEAKDALRNLITLTKIENLKDRITEIIKVGKIRIGSNPGHTIILNPEFIEAFKELWKEALNG